MMTPVKEGPLPEEDEAEDKAQKIVEEEEQAQSTNVHWTIALICVGWVSFQIYVALTGVLPPLQQRSIHLLFGIVLVYALVVERNGLRTWKGISGIILLVASALSLGRVASNYVAITYRTGQSDTIDIVAAFVVLICLFEAARRIIGLAIPIIALVVLAYSYFGEYLPGALYHSGYSLSSIAEYQVLSLQGVFGMALGVVATFVFLFVLYAGLLQVTGTGQLFIDLATGLFGWIRGGPAKIAVAASAAFGSISGSAVANVATTGPITIPLMKRVGFRARFSAAVEATASSGGQFTPPMMGAAAFLIAEILAVPFYQIALAAAIPAALYFLAVFFIVDVEAVKHDIRGLPKSELPSISKALKQGWPLLLSPVVLVYLLVIEQVSPMRAAIYTIIATVLASMVNKNTRLSLRQYLDVAVAGAKGSLEVTVACAAVGTITGVMAQTGVGFQLSGLLIGLAGGSLVLLLLLTMGASIVLGMGLPTVAAYLVLSITVAPALIEYGANPIAAHMFVFYFGALSGITPPVALASMVGASLAKTKLWPTCFEALRVAIAGFVIPYAFVFSPGLLLQGDWQDIVIGGITTIAAMILLAHGVSMHFFKPIGVVVTALLLLSAIGLMLPYGFLFYVAIVFLLGYTVLNFVQGKKKRTAKVETAEQM